MADSRVNPFIGRVRDLHLSVFSSFESQCHGLMEAFRRWILLECAGEKGGGNGGSALKALKREDPLRGYSRGEINMTNYPQQ